MRVNVVVLCLLASAASAAAQPAGKFPPDSLVKTEVIPSGTPVIEVIGMMRNMAFALGVRCQFCHVGREGQPLQEFDFASDDKRNKLVARQMMRMAREINARLDTIPERPTPVVAVTCATCHRGVSRPVPLANIVAEAAISANVDSATTIYRVLRDRYFGRDAYDFSEVTLNTAAFRIARAGKTEDALAMLRLNEELFPAASAIFVTRGNIQLMRGDTTAAERDFREALRRDPASDEARGRLGAIGRAP